VRKFRGREEERERDKEDTYGLDFKANTRTTYINDKGVLS
jgi:hypothetical protein